LAGFQRKSRGRKFRSLRFFLGEGTLTTDYESRIQWFGTLRGRIGYAWDRLLIYGTGGYAYGQIKIDGTATDSGFSMGGKTFGVSTAFSASGINPGWAAGGGIEGALFGNWIWKAEYLYVDLGALNVNAAGPFLGEAIAVHSRFNDNIVRTGLNYKWP
jgi:outer membrane immunogenic protein